MIIKFFFSTKNQVPSFDVPNVSARELISETPKWKDIVSNHRLFSDYDSSIKHTSDDTIVLGYVTPVIINSSLAYTCN